jgi:hypothetical protein
MESTRKTTQEDVARSSRKLRRLLTFLFAALVVLILLERFGAAGLQIAQHGFGGDALRRLALQCVRACPELVYLMALWYVRQALVSFANGEFYSTATTRMIDRVGATLAIGAAITLFIVPTTSRLLGFPPGYFIAYDIPSLILGAVGLSFTVIAHVLRLAAEIQAELDQIF